VRRGSRPKTAIACVLVAACCALFLTAGADSAAAGNRSKALRARASVPERAELAARRTSERDYFVEFRSRPGYLFGHTYLVYGRLGPHGRPVSEKYAGSYPLDGQRGLIIGSVIPVPSSIRGVEEDYKLRPSNVYRMRLSARRYARLTAVIRHVSANDKHWNLLFANCNDFAIEVAHGMGMSTLPSWVLPEAWIAGLRELNER
jgi:hypothetical protein